MVELSPVKPVYVLASTEPLLLDRALCSIRDAAVPPAMRGFNYDLLNARAAGAAGIIATARTLPMMAERRMVVVRGLDALPAKELQPLADYLAAPNPSTVLCIICEKIDKRLKLFATASKLGFLCELKAPKNLAQFVQGEAQRAGVPMARAATDRLIDVVGADLSRLSMAMDQLALYAAGRNISAEDVDELVASTRERSVFELTDAIGNGDFRAAQTALASLADRRESAIGVVTLLGRHMRQLGWLLEGKRLRMAKPELAQKIGAPPFVVDKLVSQARRYSSDRIGRALSLLADLDFKLKGGAEGQKVLGRDLGQRVLLLRAVRDLIALGS